MFTAFVCSETVFLFICIHIFIHDFTLIFFKEAFDRLEKEVFIFTREIPTASGYLFK